MDKQTMDQKQYKTLSDGWVAGVWKDAGEIVTLSTAQAKYENVQLVEETPEAGGRNKASK